MKYQVVILAAGKGTRMKNGDKPKVLSPLGDSTIIEHLLNNLQLPSKPLVIVGYEQQQVRDTLGDQVIYVEQTEQLGTGHAALQAKPVIDDDTDIVIILNGDQPFADQVMIDRLVREHENAGCVITMGTIKVEDYNDWRQGFYSYGRIVRGENNKILKITEQRDANKDELAILEVNPSIFAFSKDWLWQQLEDLNTNNSQSEYYLTDVIEAAFKSGECIADANIKPLKGLGANTPEQLQVLEQVLRNEIEH